MVQFYEHLLLCLTLPTRSWIMFVSGDQLAKNNSINFNSRSLRTDIAIFNPFSRTCMFRSYMSLNKALI